MIYGERRTCEELYRGTIGKYRFIIMNLGTHPTAYIKIPKTHPLYGIEYFELPDYLESVPHGGFTYSREYLFTDNKNKEDGWWLGWDYAHWGDFLGFEPYNKEISKMWTTEEIRAECKEVIEAIEEWRKQKKGSER